MNPGLPAKLHFQTGGPSTGPAVLLLHGVTRQMADLAPVIERLPAYLGWIAVDFMGHGKSPTPWQGHGYKVCDYSSDISRLVSSLPPRPLVLFGHSLGAMVAAQVAAMLPQVVIGAILEDPPFSTMGARIKESNFYLQFQGLSELLGSLSEWRPDFRSQLVAGLRELPVIRPSDGARVRMCDVRSAEAIQAYAHYLSEVDALVLGPIVAGEWLAGYDFEAIAAMITAPVLLLQADMKAGGMLTDDEANRFRSAAPRCRLKKFEGASHLIHATHADALSQEINAFLETVLPTLA